MPTAEEAAPALSMTASSREDRTVTIIHGYLRDWEAIVRSVVAGINFGGEYHLDCDSFERTKRDTFTVTFRTSGQAEVFQRFMDEHGRF